MILITELKDCFLARLYRK